MGVVFPFEPALYNHETELAEFIGHPLLDLVRPTRSRADTLQRYDLDPNLRTVVLLPGSRKKEIRSLLEPMCAAAAMLRGEGWQAVLALAPDLDERDLAEASNGCALPFTVAKDDTYNVVAAADAAIVASGTATLETALLGCPMVIVYRVSPVTYWLARRLVRVDSIGMPNIVLQRPVFPELIQADATAGAMVDAVRGLMSRRADLVEALATLRLRLGTPGAAGRAADLALQLVQ
jgi:lipid-A-disaccharide synthase